MAASLTVSATWTPKLRSITFLLSGDYMIAFDFLDANGVAVRSHTYLMKADGSGVYEGATQISATSPATLLTDMTNVLSHFDTTMTNAIGAGKVTP